MITVLTTCCLVAALTMDGTERRSAQAHLQTLSLLKQAVIAQDLGRAQELQKEIQKDWTAEVMGLNCLIDHRFTREVSSALLRLETALEHQWPRGALLAVGALESALRDIEVADSFRLENFL